MDEVVLKDLKQSSRAFRTIVWPEISDWIGGGELRHVETAPETSDFDILAGIDAWQVLTEEGIRGIASRVQFDYGYNTFTIRQQRMTGAETEYEKRKRAIEHGWLYPYWTIHAYVNIDKCELLSVGLIKTKDLISCISNGVEGTDYHRRAVTKNGSAFFYFVTWEALYEAGYKIRTMPKIETLGILGKKVLGFYDSRKGMMYVRGICFKNLSNAVVNHINLLERKNKLVVIKECG